MGVVATTMWPAQFRSLPAACMLPQLSHSCTTVAAKAAAAHASSPAAAQQLPPAAPTAAYVHLPFCKRKCFYCDFPVEAVGLNVQQPRTQDRMAAYVDLVCAEIRATARLGQQPLETVSFGGGTPSLVPPALLQEILAALQEQYGICPTAEVSLEADPGTFDLPRLQQYKALGVNRLSMGVQSFDQELLQTCGRSHSLAEVYAAIEAVKAAGFPSWSLDLISGLPKLTQGIWQHSLDQAVAAGPNHISIYDLQVEQGTPFARWFSGQDSPLPKEPEAVAMFEAAAATLAAAGYEHYEISNYAQPGHRSRHNQVYWHCQPYYAFGLGAASYTRGRRFTRPRGMQEYEQWVQAYVSTGGGCPAAQLPPESQEDQLLDRIMLQLRLSDGLDLQAVQQDFGQPVVAALLPVVGQMVQQGRMQFVQQQPLVQQQQDQQKEQQHHVEPPAGSRLQQGSPGSSPSAAASSNQQQPSGSSSSSSSTLHNAEQQLQERLLQGLPCRVRLTDPQGFLLSNDVIAELFAALDASMLAPAAGAAPAAAAAAAAAAQV